MFSGVRKFRNFAVISKHVMAEVSLVLCSADLKGKQDNADYVETTVNIVKGISKKGINASNGSMFISHF